MFRIELSVACLILVGFSANIRAQAPTAVLELETLSPEEKGEFQAWLINRGRTLDIPFPYINMINVDMADKSIKERIYTLEGFISADDFKVLNYLEMMETNFRKYKRLNPFDRALLASMKLFGISRKQAWIDRFNRFTDEQGIKVKPVELKGVVSAAVKATLERRYNLESGLYERYDDKTKAWVSEK